MRCVKSGMRPYQGKILNDEGTVTKNVVIKELLIKELINFFISLPPSLLPGYHLVIEHYPTTANKNALETRSHKVHPSHLGTDLRSTNPIFEPPKTPIIFANGLAKTYSDF